MSRVVVSLCAFLLLSGCLDLFGRDDPSPSYEELGWEGTDRTGTDQGAWPDLDGVRITILETFDWPMMADAVDLFEDLTGAEVVREFAETPEQALEDIDTDRPEHDIVFGLDKLEVGLAMAAGSLRPYEPLLYDQVTQYRAGTDGSAIPFQHQYVAVQAYGTDRPVRTLFDLREQRTQAILPDPLVDPIGRALLLTTVAYFGEDPNYGYNWQLYWGELFQESGCVTIVDSHEEAYRAFLGLDAESTHNISVGPTSLPAFLVENGTLAAAQVPDMVLATNQTWHLVHHSAIVEGTRNRAAAEAWQEFTLTDAFQDLVARSAAYSIQSDRDTSKEHAPDPTTFRSAFIPVQTLAQRWSTWSMEFQTLREEADCPS